MSNVSLLKNRGKTARKRHKSQGAHSAFTWTRGVVPESYHDLSAPESRHGKCCIPEFKVRAGNCTVPSAHERDWLSEVNEFWPHKGLLPEPRSVIQYKGKREGQESYKSCCGRHLDRYM